MAARSTTAAANHPTSLLDPAACAAATRAPLTPVDGFFRSRWRGAQTRFVGFCPCMWKMFRLLLVKIPSAQLRDIAGIQVAIMPMQELRDIRAGRQGYPDSGTAGVFGIVEQEPFAHFTRRVAHHGIGIGVVSRRALKHFHAQRPLFELVEVARQGVVHDVLQQGRDSACCCKNADWPGPPLTHARSHHGLACSAGAMLPVLHGLDS